MAAHLTQEMLSSQLRASIPKLSSSLHKGQHGRLGVIGGSFEYSGAPYYAATAGYRTGSDLAYIFCCKEAGLPIKSYSPENIVLPILRTTAEAEQDLRVPPGDSLTTEQYEQVKQQIISDLRAWIKPLHVLVVGPGLGRDPLMLSCAMEAVRAARERELPIILDGDALFALNSSLDVVQGYPKAILTPNPVEYRRLYNAVAETLETSEVPPLGGSSVSPNATSPSPLAVSKSDDDASSKTATDDGSEITRPELVSSTNKATAADRSVSSSLSSLPPLLDSTEESVSDPKSVKKLAAALGGVTIVRKGQFDVISDGKKLVQCTRSGGLRRCGGQGDVLAGIISTLAGWNFGPESAYELSEKLRKREGHRFTASRTMLAAWGACALTREASRRAYEQHHRGTTTPLILEHVGPAFYDLCEHYTSDSAADGEYTQEL